MADEPERSTVGHQILTVPNLLSLLRLLLVPVFGWLIVTGHDAWALAVLAFSGASDWFDGFLARRFHQVTRLGQLLDPAADRFYILTTLLGLAWRGYVPWWLLVLIVARDAVLACTLPVLARHGYGPLPVHYLGKTATFGLLFAFPLLLVGRAFPVLAPVADPIGWAFAWWATALYWWAALLYLRQVRDVTRAPGDGPDRDVR